MSLLNIFSYIISILNCCLTACSTIITFFSGILCGQLLLSLAWVYLTDSLVSLTLFVKPSDTDKSRKRCPCFNGSTRAVSFWPRRLLV